MGQGVTVTIAETGEVALRWTIRTVDFRVIEREAARRSVSPAILARDVLETFCAECRRVAVQVERPSEGHEARGGPDYHKD